MSRFGTRKSTSKSRSSRGSKTTARGRNNKRKNSNGGFQNVGSLSTAKDVNDHVVEELRESDDIKLWWTVYLPEDVNSMTLKHGDRVFIQLGNFHEKAPDWVVGSVSLPPEE